MAEICCEVASGGEATTVEACEPSSRAARRRRMQIRRIRLVSGSETMEGLTEPMRKRQRVEIPGDCTGMDGGGGDGVGLRLKRERPAGESLVRFGMTAVCGRRREMEDTVSVHPDLGHGRSGFRGLYEFYGVFDGHGCSHVAVSCRDRMHELVAEELEKNGSAPPEWEGVMARSFERMDAEVSGGQGTLTKTNTCRCELRTPNCDHVGSTAVVAVVTPEQLVVANCGDSRAVLCRGGVAIPLSSDHKPDRPDEMERIEAAGGRVIYWDGARVLGVLAMSRAIGDGYLKPYVISEPEVKVMERKEEDECLILASDGLWDVVTNEMACEIARMCLRGGSDKACTDAAILLTKLALARQSADNVSVVVVDLRRDDNSASGNSGTSNSTTTATGAAGSE
ncbi:protein phosphatase 2C protein [Dioscorea alata]|uniref:Protein phosphatase 2C protein n=1 Tax=Dioscorea alata TaxID=55571 RepID=A0ACB7VG76_DIOAL|nr:protein phosphatase 2C protein [Dioscorea alata]